MNLLETEAISVSDDECYYFNEYGTVQKICELLNELHEENQRLQHFESLYRERNLKLEKENKELRSDRDYWKTLAQSLARTNGNIELKDEHIGWKRVDVE